MMQNVNLLTLASQQNDSIIEIVLRLTLASQQNDHFLDVNSRTETGRTRQESHVLNGKRKSSIESDGLDYFGCSEESLSSKRCKNLKGSPDSPPLQGILKLLVSNGLL